MEDPTRIIEEWRVPASARFMPGIEDGVEVRAGIRGGSQRQGHHPAQPGI